MASIFIKLRISDFDTWKAAFDEIETRRRRATVTAHSLHRDANDPGVVILAFRVTNLGRAKAFVTSDDLVEIMQQAGVEGPLEVWFTEDIEEKTY